VAPGRERVYMLSWVAMERIYEHEVLPDAKLRQHAGERPLRIDAKRLTDGELLAKLRSCAPWASRSTGRGWRGSARGRFPRRRSLVR